MQRRRLFEEQSTVLEERRRNKITDLPVVTFKSDLAGPTVNCAVCLSDYEEGDRLQTLPCHRDHTFHKDCIEPWLILHATCPTCRANVFPDLPDTLPPPPPPIHAATRATATETARADLGIANFFRQINVTISNAAVVHHQNQQNNGNVANNGVANPPAFTPLHTVVIQRDM